MLTLHELRLYHRYNRRLLLVLQHFYNHRLSALQKGTIEEKKEFVTSIKPILEKSAALKRKMPRHVVPTAMILELLYDILYKHNGYLAALESQDEKKIKNIEEETEKFILSRLGKIAYPKHVIGDKQLYHEAKHEFKHLGKRVKHEIKHKSGNSFLRIATAIAVMYIFMGLVPAFAQVANEPYVTAESKERSFKDLGKELDGMFDGVVSVIEKGHDGLQSRIKLLKNEKDVEEEAEELTVDEKKLALWVETLGLDDQHFLREIISSPADTAGMAFSKALEKSLGGHYSVELTTSSSANPIKTSIDSNSVTSLNKKLDEYNSSKYKQMNGQLIENTVYVDKIVAGLNNDGHFVLTFRESLVKDGKMAYRQSVIVVTPK